MQTLVHLTASDLSILCVCVYIHIHIYTHTHGYVCIHIYIYRYIPSFLNQNVNAYSEYHHSRVGEEPSYSCEQGWAGNVSFDSLLSPFRLFLSKLTWFLKQNYRN